ncbi:MAG: hypothetical protein HXX17_01640, partial [Geobacteraceae bacterium]|nr:hypothetical protein [Geobacteraceae bacterium]
LEEYNDNIYETRSNRLSGFITHISPSLKGDYNSRLWTWNLNYEPEYIMFHSGKQGNELRHNLLAAGNIRLIDNFLYLNISDEYKKNSFDGNRQTQYANLYNQNIFSVSPYIDYRINPRWSASAGYRYVNRSYSGSQSINNEEHGGFLKLTRDTGPRSNVYTKADYSRIIPETGQSHDRLTHVVGAEYRHAKDSNIHAEAGYSIFFPASGGSTTTSPFWNVGILQAVDQYRFSLDSGVTFDNDPGLSSSERRSVSGRIERDYSRGVIGIYGRYNDTINSTDNANSQWFTTGIDVSHLVTLRVTSHFSLSTDKYLNNSRDLYRNLFTAGVKYEVYKDLYCGIDYNRIAYSDSFFSPIGPIEANRIMVFVTKTFQGLNYKQN